MFLNLLALKLKYAMSVYQKFGDCKTAGPFLCPLTLLLYGHVSKGLETNKFKNLIAKIDLERGLDFPI